MRSTRIVGLLSLTLVGAFALGCHNPTTGTMQVRTNSAVVSTVAAYRTYSHETADQAPMGYLETALTPAVLEKVWQRVDVEMANKGYVLVPSGELVVRISEGTRDVKEEPKGRAAVQGAPSEHAKIQSLVIDIFDRNTEGHLFHGYARDEIHDSETNEARISEAVHDILQPVPARKPTP
jgi:hypothetical protein